MTSEKIDLSKVVTEIVYSPDDGGFWISQFDLNSELSRASIVVFPSERAAKTALRDDSVAWEVWS